MKKEARNQYIVITKENLSRLELLQGFAENESLNIRLLINNINKSRNFSFNSLTMDKFESIQPFYFEQNTFHDDKIKDLNQMLQDIKYYEKFFEPKKGFFNCNKAIIFLDDFLYQEEKLRYKSFSESKKLPNINQGGLMSSLVSLINKLNFIFYSDIQFFKNIIKYINNREYFRTSKFYFQLYQLLKAIKIANIQTLIFADAKKYENTFEGLLIRTLLTNYGIKYNFTDFDYILNENNFHFVYPLKFLIFKNKKHIYIKYHLKQIYDKNFNTNFINNEKLLNAERAASIEDQLHISNIKDKNKNLFFNEKCKEKQTIQKASNSVKNDFLVENKVEDKLFYLKKHLHKIKFDELAYNACVSFKTTQEIIYLMSQKRSLITSKHIYDLLFFINLSISFYLSKAYYLCYNIFFIIIHLLRWENAKLLKQA